MSKHIPISAVIPCYNYGDYIGQAIESLLEQTYLIDEIIIVDDGSTEESTLTKLKSFTSPLIKVCFNENKGVSAARNFGFNLAKNEIIVTIDSDDYFRKDFIEKALPLLVSNDNVGAVSCWAQCFGEKNNILQYRNANLFDFFIKNQAVNAALIKKEAWAKARGYDETMLHGLEDWDFWIRVNKSGYSVNIIPEALFFYRIKKTSKNTAAMQQHSALYKELLHKHKDVFTHHFPEIYLYILEHKERINTSLYKSIDYKIGNFILRPLRYIQYALRLLFHH